MLIFTTSRELQKFLKNRTNIAFVPTMGALHSGHISLIEKAKSQSKTMVCSIFVNPKQFNNLEDLEKYPKQTENDISMLEKAGCQVLFLPTEKEMYPKNLDFNLDFKSNLFDILEGEFRPGHFIGVATVVKRLFDIVKPDLAFFGQKDYQQVLVIKELVKFYNLNTKIVGCPIIREKNGLAMSSRNQRLSQKEQEIASNIYKNLIELKEKISEKKVNLENLQIEIGIAIKSIEKNKSLKVEYLQIKDAEKLEKASKKTTKAVILTAVWLNEVRLIDNLEVIFK